MKYLKKLFDCEDMTNTELAIEAAALVVLILSWAGLTSLMFMAV